MSKYLGWIVLGAAILFLMVGCGTYKTNVSLRNGVDASVGNMQQQYQRRNDLIPNLVATVQGAAAQNQVFVEIARARAGVTAFANTSPQELAANPQLMQQYLAAQAALGRATSASQFRIVTEAYPELRSNENFLQLQSQIESTEDRIGAARRDYNAAVLAYNNQIQTPPGMFFPGFTPRTPYTASSDNVETAPTVSFNPPAAPATP